MKKILIVMVLIIFVCGCSSNKDSIKFKEKFERYNKESYVNVYVDEDNIFKLDTSDEINSLLSGGTGVIFVGKDNDNLSRISLNILNKVIDNTDINIVHYTSDLDILKGYVNEDDLKYPIVLFAREGEKLQYHSGTILDKAELSDDEELELYNIYLDGVHIVLNDVCDEKC